MAILIENLLGKIEMSFLALIDYVLDFTLSHPMFVLDTCIYLVHACTYFVIKKQENDNDTYGIHLVGKNIEQSFRTWHSD